MLSAAGQGVDAQDSNHGVWYDVQLLATALHTGRGALAQQIDAVNGSLPAEDAPDPVVVLPRVRRGRPHAAGPLCATAAWTCG